MDYGGDFIDAGFENAFLKDPGPESLPQDFQDSYVEAAEGCQAMSGAPSEVYAGFFDPAAVVSSSGIEPYFAVQQQAATVVKLENVGGDDGATFPETSDLGEFGSAAAVSSEEAGMGSEPGDEPGSVDDEDESAELRPAKNAFVVSHMPSFPNFEIPLKEKIEVLVGFMNQDPEGSEHFFSLNAVTCAFYYPFDASYLMGNFSEMRYNATVRAGEQQTIYYAFTPELYEPRDFLMTVRLHYSDEEDEFVHVAFNRTISIVDAVDSMDLRTLFVYLFAGSATLLAGFLAIKTYSGARKRIRRRAARGAAADAGAGRGSADVDDWVKDHILPQGGPRKQVGKRRGGKR